jgi:Na+/H+ antiporter NhaC
VDGNIILTVCSIAGGSCFGDNIGLISDTTVLSSGLQDVEIMHRVKHQGIWSISCLIITALIILLLGMGLPSVIGDARQAIDSIPPEAYEALSVERPSAILLLEQVKSGVPLYMIIPLFIVVIMAFAGVQTMICLGAGMVSSLIFGMMSGTTDISQWLNDMLLVGFGDAGSWSIVMMMWIAAFGGIMNSMHAFEPLAKLIVKVSKNVRQLMGWCGVLCLAGNVALSDETAEIATMSPIIRNIVEENVEGSPESMYKLRLRLATFADALGVYGSQLIPWHCYVVFYTAISNAVFPIYKFLPFDIIRMNVMGIVAVSSMLILTFTGLDKYIPLFKLPSEPEVTLKKSSENDVELAQKVM